VAAGGHPRISSSERRTVRIAATSRPSSKLLCVDSTCPVLSTCTVCILSHAVLYVRAPLRRFVPLRNSFALAKSVDEVRSHWIVKREDECQSFQLRRHGCDVLPATLGRPRCGLIFDSGLILMFAIVPLMVRVASCCFWEQEEFGVTSCVCLHASVTGRVARS
jgi:hypothetical protein